MMYVRAFRSHVGSRLGALALAAGLLVVVGVFLAFGFFLILGLTAAGLVLGIAATIYRRLTGQRVAPLNQQRHPHGLDPALEVTAPPATLHVPEGTVNGETSHPRTRVNKP